MGLGSSHEVRQIVAGATNATRRVGAATKRRSLPLAPPRNIAFVKSCLQRRIRHALASQWRLGVLLCYVAIASALSFYFAGSSPVPKVPVPKAVCSADPPTQGKHEL